MKKLFTALLFCTLLVTSCMTAEERKKEKAKAAIEKIIEDEKEFVTHAYIIAQDLVRNKLKAPSTAVFPNSDYTAGPVFSKGVEIKSYVDSQNGFGAQIRTNYTIYLQQTGNDWADVSNWKIIDFQTY